VRTRKWKWFGMRAQAYTARCPSPHSAANRVTKSARSLSSRKLWVRSMPRTMIWCRVSVEDSGRRAEPKIPDAVRKGIEPGLSRHAGMLPLHPPKVNAL